MTRLISVALAVLGSGCASSPALNRSEPSPLPDRAAAPSGNRPKAADRPPTTRESRLIQEMLRRVEAARGQPALRPVPGVVLPREELIARVKDHVSRELPPQAIRNEGLALQLFGFLPTPFDYEGAEYALLQDQLAGYYEPADGTMYMASDLGADEASATLAHELVHALQDQHWDLASRSKYRPGGGDASEALSALAEGDATSAMFDVMLSRAPGAALKTAAEIPDDVFVAQIQEGMSQDHNAKAPQVMRASLAAPYVYGTLFVNALRRRGGWTEVDRAWADVPTTTEQILHLEKWDQHEAALLVPPPPFVTLGPAWQVADEDSEGELGTRIAFEEWMDSPAAARASAGWGGDRALLLADASGELVAFAWRLRFDPPAPSREDRATSTFLAIGQALDQALGPAHARDSAFTCRERVDRGPLAVARVGRDILFVFGPARIGPGGWVSAGTCSVARRWVEEVRSKAR
jgi:hypothetical protein